VVSKLYLVKPPPFNFVCVKKGFLVFNFNRILMGKLEGKRPLGRPRRRWMDNIKMDLREIGLDGMDWIVLVQDRDQCRDLLNTVMNPRVP
jgi:hypothetical protein